MKKQTKELDAKSVKELQKEISSLRTELAKGQLEQKVSMPKDTNNLMKKRKKLAIMLTILKEKEMKEAMK